MDQHDLALELLQLGADDLLAATVLARSREIRDTIIGFHCQQAAEKSLKAVLADGGIDYPKTHNLLVLTNLLKAAGHESPIATEDLAKLNPYAVARRYDAAELHGLDRASALDLAGRVQTWADEQIRGPDSGPG